MVGSERLVQREVVIAESLHDESPVTQDELHRGMKGVSSVHLGNAAWHSVPLMAFIQFVHMYVDACLHNRQ